MKNVKNISDPPRRRILRSFCYLILISMTFACSNDSQDTAGKLSEVVAIESGDECHLCGMIIHHHPGPKGQTTERMEADNKKFCSTRDMFAYILDPEHTHNIESVFVHDMEVNPWEKPDEDTYIDGRTAWYVIGSSQRGAMGPTLASFSKKEVAQEFSEIYGGKLVSFEEINLENL